MKAAAANTPRRRSHSGRHERRSRGAGVADCCCALRRLRQRVLSRGDDADHRRRRHLARAIQPSDNRRLRPGAAVPGRHDIPQHSSTCSCTTRTSSSTSSITWSDARLSALLKIAASLPAFVFLTVLSWQMVRSGAAMRCGFNEVSPDLAIPMSGALVSDDRRHRARLSRDGLNTCREH